MNAYLEVQQLQAQNITDHFSFTLELSKADLYRAASL